MKDTSKNSPSAALMSLRAKRSNLPKSYGRSLGFTLLELVMAVTLSGLIVGSATLAFEPVLDTWSLNTPINESTDAASYALSRILFETSQIKDPTSVIVANSGELQFTDVSDNSVDYVLSGSNLMRNTDILARGVQNISFQYFDINDALIVTPQVAPAQTDIWRIVIQMTVERDGQSVTMETAVHPRNLPRT